MDSIYLRSIGNNLTTRSGELHQTAKLLDAAVPLELLRHCNGKLRHCDECKESGGVYTLYTKLRPRIPLVDNLLTFCCISHGNDYHLKYDIGASVHTIFALLWLRQIMDDNDVVRLIASLLYKIRKRKLPLNKCNVCFYTANTPQFVNNLCFCSKTCRNSFFETKGYNSKQIRKLTIKSKSDEELNQVYRW